MAYLSSNRHRRECSYVEALALVSVDDEMSAIELVRDDMKLSQFCFR